MREKYREKEGREGTEGGRERMVEGGGRQGGKEREILAVESLA